MGAPGWAPDPIAQAQREVEAAARQVKVRATTGALERLSNAVDDLDALRSGNTLTGGGMVVRNVSTEDDVARNDVRIAVDPPPGPYC